MIKDLQETITANGAKAYHTTLNSTLDFYSMAGSVKSEDDIKTALDLFLAAYSENSELAMRALFWSRDVRGGAGRRELFRQCIATLCTLHPGSVKVNIDLIAEFGRWDDLLCLIGTPMQDELGRYLRHAMKDTAKAGLLAKWLPREKQNPKMAKVLANMLGFANMKLYRQWLSATSKTVEQKMCKKAWTEISYSGVPSRAMSIYNKAFVNHDPVGFTEWKAAVTRGDAKVNAGAVYPYQITSMVNTDAELAQSMWNAMPNWVTRQARILPMVDVSSSMNDSGGSTPTPMQNSIALGILASEKLATPGFRDQVLTFHSTPTFVTLTGTLKDKVNTLKRAPWGGSTDIEAAFKMILAAGVNNGLTNDDMPEVLLVLSDMEFNQNSRGKTTFLALKEDYEKAGYTMPVVVFWNLKATSKPQVQFDTPGVVCVSGFSQSTFGHILSADIQDMKDMMDPVKNMLKVLNGDRYSIIKA